MKIAKRKTYRARQTKPPMFILDEFNHFGSSPNELPAMSRTKVTRRVIATQAVMKFNSGKRVRFLGSTHWEDTGESTKPAPKKFVPAQVLRRAAA